MKHLRDYQKEANEEAITHCRQYPDPFLMILSVGSGKTLMIADLAKNTTMKGGNVLVLAHQTELIKQNSDEAWEYFEDCSRKPSICAGQLNLYGQHFPLFAMRKTLHNRLSQPPYCNTKVDLIIVDEVHTFDFLNPESVAAQIYQHYKNINPGVRLVGLTGTPYRNNEPLYQNGFFNHKTSRDINLAHQIEQGWIIPYHFGLHSHEEEIDFSSLEITAVEEAGGRYSEAEIDKIYQGEWEKTFRICHEVHHKAQKMKNGTLIFCGSKLHTKQVFEGLVSAGADPESIAIVTDDTKDDDRTEALNGSKSGRIKYFVNVGVASTGWNCPPWEYLVYMRPVGSFTFFEQSLGRVLRPMLTNSQAIEFNADETTAERRKEIIQHSAKPYAVVDDFAGVVERLGPMLDGDIFIDEAKRERAKKEGNVKVCPICSYENGEYAQRCINRYDQGNGMDDRCLHFWIFNECRDEHCRDELGRRTQNAVTAKNCRICDKIMIDPNAALLNRAYRDDEYREVDRMEIALAKSKQGVLVKFHLKEKDPDVGTPYLYFHVDGSESSKRIWYNNFVKYYVAGPSWQGRMRNYGPEAIIKNKAIFNTPTHITVRKNDKGKFIIGKRIFKSGRECIENNFELS